MPLSEEQIQKLLEDIKDLVFRMETAETRLRERDKIVYDLLHPDLQALIDDGDMLKATYDANANDQADKADDSDLLEGHTEAEVQDHTPKAHKTSHEDTGTDEISVAGLSGELADNQPPKAHKANHEDTGGDEISVAGLSGELVDDQPPLAVEVTASANLKASADTERCGYDTVYTKKKEIKMRVNGTVRVNFDLKRYVDNSQGREVQARYYVNGVAVGDVEATTSLTYITFGGDTINVLEGDLIQLYAREFNGDEGYCVRNFRLSWDKATVADYSVETN